jgi:hypothetical protein
MPRLARQDSVGAWKPRLATGDGWQGWRWHHTHMQERLPAADSPPITRCCNVKPGAAGTGGVHKPGHQQ